MADNQFLNIIHSIPVHTLTAYSAQKVKRAEKMAMEGVEIPQWLRQDIIDLSQKVPVKKFEIDD
jgi:hypothetical protein